MSRPNDPDVVALVAAVLLGADRVREQVFYASTGNASAHWSSTSHDEAIEEAQRLVLRCHAVAFPVSQGEP